MKKNMSILFVVMLVAGMVLSACGGSAPAPAATKAPVKEPAATKSPAATEAPAAEAPAGWLENTVNNMPDHRAPTDEEMAVMDGDFQAVAQALGLSGSGTAYSSMSPAGTSSEAVYQYFSDQSKAASFDANTMTPDGGSAESAIHYAVFPNPDGGNFVIVVTPLTTGVGIKALAFEGDVSAPAATEAPAEAPVGGTEIQNSTDFDWCEIYVSPVSEDNWGDNQLPDGEQIAVGESFTLQNLPAGTYDVNLTGCDGSSEATIQVEVSQ